MTYLMQALNPSDTTAYVNSVSGKSAPRILRVNSELIYYTGIDLSNIAFTGCIRGLLNTTPALQPLYTGVTFITLSLGVSFNESGNPYIYFTNPVTSDQIILLNFVVPSP